MEDTSTTANGTTPEGFTDEERAAIKERANELRSTARPGPKADGESAVLAKIAEMPDADRAIAERLHAVIKAIAPGLVSKLWYGMPAYWRDRPRGRRAPDPRSPAPGRQQIAAAKENQTQVRS
jgi:hypothetical protein